MNACCKKEADCQFKLRMQKPKKGKNNIKKIFKRHIILVSSIIILLGCSNLVVLADTKDVSQTKLLENGDTLSKFVNDDGTTSFKIERSDEKVNEEIENFKKNYENTLQLRRGPKEEYKTTYSAPKRVRVTGLVDIDGWPEGVQFCDGGYILYSESGGPKATAKVSFPTPYGTFSISGNLGRSSVSSGVGIPVPAKNYYKLSVTKEYEVTAYVTYKRLKGEPESAWKIYSKGTSIPVRKNCTYNVVMVKKGDPNDCKKESKSID